MAMPILIYLLLACAYITPVVAAELQPALATPAEALAVVAETDSLQMEKELQHLRWNQFRSVIESVPKMKADVDAYGPLGWQYVHSHYETYGWKKSIDRLDDEQKQHLAELIQIAKKSP